MKYTVRIERQQNLISVSCDGNLIWSSSNIDEKRASVSKHVRNFNKYPTTKDAAKLALNRAFPLAKVKIPWWLNRRKNKKSP